MIPVVTPEEMKAVDAAAEEPVDVLIERAGAAVARFALDVLGGTYGRRVVVVAGKGNNGADGRAAARRLEARGLRVSVFGATSCPKMLPPSDLVIDAAFGTGFRGTYDAPDPGDAFVLAVDVPSGVNGLTGEATAGAVRADATVTFAALKPGLLYDRGEHCGVVTVVDIGLDISSASAQLVEPIDIGVPRRPPDAHKYHAAVMVVGGSARMPGAPALCARAAFRAGSGYVRLGVPGTDLAVGAPSEAVGVGLPASGWADAVLGACDRMKALAIGPGLGREDGTLKDVARVLSQATIPTVVDGDGLYSPLDRARSTRVLTPHEGEYEHLAGARPGPDRLADARRLAAKTGATVLLKGPTTVTAAPDGRARFSMTGGPRLATAGTGDVLTGMIVALLACGLDPLDAASFGACAHGLAARAGGKGEGLVASDVIDHLPGVLWPLGAGGA